MVRFLGGVPSADVDQETGEMLPECLEYNKRFNLSWGGYSGPTEDAADDEAVFNAYHALVAERAANAEPVEPAVAEQPVAEAVADVQPDVQPAQEQAPVEQPVEPAPEPAQEPAPEVEQAPAPAEPEAAQGW